MLKRLFLQYQLYLTGGLAVLLFISLGYGALQSARLDACKSARKSDKVEYILASERALKGHLEAIKTKEDVYEKKADEADKAYDTLVIKYRNTLRLFAKVKSPTSYTPASPQSGSPEGRDGPSESSLIPTSFTDLEICTENTARLQAAREWGLSLNK
jgi:hypothetical protein